MRIGQRIHVKHCWLLWGPWLAFGIGFLMNAIVMAANKGQMPVLVPGGNCSLLNEDDIIHSCMTHATHLKVIADWIVINHFGIASPGDFLEWACNLTFLPALSIWFTLHFVREDHAQSLRSL